MYSMSCIYIAVNKDFVVGDIGGHIEIHICVTSVSLPDLVTRVAPVPSALIAMQQCAQASRPHP